VIGPDAPTITADRGATGGRAEIEHAAAPVDRWIVVGAIVVVAIALGAATTTILRRRP
jgi:hypothetical protein